MNPRFLLLVPLLLALAYQPDLAASAEVVAEALSSELQPGVWDAPYGEWQRARPGASCKPSRGGGSDQAYQQWCYHCAQHSQTHTVEWFFYIFGLQEPLVCRLERVQASMRGLSKETMREVRQALIRRLTTAFGPPAKIGGLSPKDYELLQRYGRPILPDWLEGVRWQTSDLQIYLGGSESGVLILEAQHRHLLDALAEDTRLVQIAWGRWAVALGTPLAQRLAEELRAAFPNLPALLAQWVDLHLQKLSEREREEIHTTLLRILENTGTASRERRLAFLLAADLLVGRLTYAPSPEGDRQRRELAKYGFTYRPEPWSGIPAYMHDLLWRVWNEYGDTKWGEHAFLLLLNGGWDTSPDCARGKDQFREVIRRGEEFLAKRPQTPHRLDLLFALAQAYETWWSLSQAFEDDDYVVRAKYQQGATAAREKAIAYYEQVLRLAPESDLAAYVRRQLPRLKLGIDTGQRHFFCVIWD